MSLTLSIKQKNEELLLKKSVIQETLSERLSVPECSSFLITFALAPFVVGAAISLLGRGTKHGFSRFLGLAFVPGLRWNSLFKLFSKRELHL